MKLVDLHREYGAHLMQAGDSFVVRNFSDPADEYLSVQNGAGIFDLSLRGKILVAGEDMVPFLDGVVSADIKNLPQGQWAYAAILTPKGKYRADLKVFNTLSGMLLDSPPFTPGIVIAALKSFRFRSKVTIEDLTEKYSLISLQGPESVSLAQSAGLKLLSENVQEVRQVSFGKEHIWLASLSETGYPGLWIWTTVENAPNIWRSLTEAGAKPCGMDVLNVLRIEAGIPAWGRDIDDDVIPPEAGQERALCYSKCYPGQEVVSRIHFRGHVNRLLQIVKLESEEIPPRLTPLVTDTDVIGHLTTATRHPVSGEIIGFGYLRRQVILDNSPVFCEWDGSRKPARIQPLPYRPVD